MVLIATKKTRMAVYKLKPSKTMNSHTNAHAVRGRLTSTRCRERHFRAESIYRELNSKNDKANTQIYSNTQQYSNETQNTRNATVQANNFTTNSLVHSYMDNPEPLHSIKPLRCVISREWPFYLTISLLFICLWTFCLIHSFDYHVLFLLCAIVVACLVYVLSLIHI